MFSMVTMFVFYQNLRFSVDRGVYEPAEDTFFIANNLDVKEGERVLDLGTGCGILGILGALAGGFVTSTDINPIAVSCAKRNAHAHGVYNKMMFKVGNLFEPIEKERFDLIMFNPPYLPSSGQLNGDPIGLACEGGTDGRSVVDSFLGKTSEHLKAQGRIVLVQSSLSHPEKTINKLVELGFDVKIVRKKLDFEELILIKGRLRKGL